MHKHNMKKCILWFNIKIDIENKFKIKIYLTQKNLKKN